jgi:hypothetical protein
LLDIKSTKNAKKLSAIMLIIMMIVLTIGNVILYAQPSGVVRSSFDINGLVFSDTPVHILGESSITDSVKLELERVTSNIFATPKTNLLSKLKPEQDILVIDGLWLENDASTDIVENLQNVVLQGTPVLVMAGPSTILDEIIEKMEISMTLAHSDVNSIVVHGLKYYPETGAVSSLEIAGKEAKDGVVSAYEWARKYLSNIPIYPEPEHHSPWWQWRYTFTFYSQTEYSPYGQFNIVTDYYRLEEDGTGTYKWYTAHYRVQSVPGYTAYGNDWVTDSIYTRHDADSYSGCGSNILNDYDPTTTSGTQTVGVSVGVTYGEYGATVTSYTTWSYSISDLVIQDTSNFGTQVACWTHDLDRDTDVAKYTFTGELGSTDRAPEAGKYGISDGYHVTWTRWHWIIWPFWGDWQYNTVNMIVVGDFT